MIAFTPLPTAHPSHILGLDKSPSIHNDPVRATTAFSAVALTREIATSSQRVGAASQARSRLSVTSKTLGIVPGATVLEALCLTSLQAVGHSSIGAAAVSGQRNGATETALCSRVGVAAKQAPRLEALSREESLIPAVIRDDGEAGSGTALLGAVAFAGHLAVGLGGLGSGSGASAPAFVGVLGSGVLVAAGLAGHCALLLSLGGGGTGVEWQSASGAAVNEAARV